MELAEREVSVSRFDELWHDGDRRGFAIECSSGTYVRSLIADLGDAYCVELRRTAHRGLRRRRRRPGAPGRLADALGFLPEVRLDGEAARRAAHGVRVDAPAAAPAGPVVAARPTPTA